MQFAKRILVFVLTNILVVATLSLLLSIFNVQPYLSARGIDYQQLAFFCLIWGFGGAFISLLMSKVAAKWMMGVKVLDPKSSQLTHSERDLVERVHEYARKAGLSKMPEVGIYESRELNAFATGPSRRSSLVAVSTGLLTRMDRDQVDGVLAHEVAHIANGDMVTMTLVQGVMNAFVMFIARILSSIIAQNVREESRGAVRMIVTIVLEIVLSLVAYLVVAAVSRAREFRADSGGAKLAGKEKMILALQGLKRNLGVESQEEQHESLATLKISGKSNAFLNLMSTHPPLDTRIQALRDSR